MKFSRTFLFFLAALLPASAFAARVDTLAVHSAAMNKEVGVAVVTPDDYGTQPLPTVYLLHGYGDNHLRGYLGLTNVRDLVDALDVIVAIPDAESSWYFDSPVNPSLRYETFVSDELVRYMDTNYNTVPTRSGRAVTGLSMGGHGALYLAIRHQDVFGAAGSMSGGVDFTPFPEKWNIKDALGDIADHPENWKKNTVMAQLPLLKDGALRLIVDCGTEDFFYQVNCNLHEALMEKGIGHEFTTRPGVHNWDYWRRSLRDHLLFFHDYFKEAVK